MQFRATIHAELNTFTGYGQHLVEIARGLERRGGFVNIRPIRTIETFGAKVPLDVRSKVVNRLQPEPWELLLSPPHFLPTPGKRTLYFTMWETTELPKTSVALLNRAEAVIVPTAWNAKAFKKCGVKVPIYEVPLGIDTSVITPWPMVMTGPTIFGAAGRFAHGGKRKGLEEAVEVFCQSFHRNMDVRLHVKCYPDCAIKEVSDPRVTYLREHMNERQHRDWLRRLTAFVSLARGEGWGLWQHQASATGRPVVTAFFGGLRQFLGMNHCYPVGYREVPATDSYAGCGNWAELNLGQAMEQLRRIHLDREEAREVGLMVSESVRHLTWDHSIDQLCRVMKKVGAI